MRSSSLGGVLVMTVGRPANQLGGLEQRAADLGEDVGVELIGADVALGAAQVFAAGAQDVVVAAVVVAVVGAVAAAHLVTVAADLAVAALDQPAQQPVTGLDAARAPLRVLAADLLGPSERVLVDDRRHRDQNPLLARALAAQEPEPATRAAALRQQRLKKQQALVPNTIDWLQRALNRIEDPPIFLVARDGFYPKIGKLTTGSGPTLGVGYRNRTVLDRDGILDGWIAGSIETYWGIEGRITFPELARGRVLAEGFATLREYPREAYFGLGPDSQRSDRSAFLLKSSRVGGRAGVRLAPFVLVGAGLTTISPRVGAGKEDGVPTTEDLFTPETAPGIDADVSYVVSTGFVELDYSRPLNARRGGSYRVDFSRFNDRRDGNWSFTRTDIDLRQYISFLADRRVLALRGCTDDDR